MPLQADLFDAEGEARLGAAKALQHADDVKTGWADAAFNVLRAFAFERPYFLVEDVRKFATLRGLPPPPDNRAWGAVVTRAASAGFIRPDGHSKTRFGPGHARPVTRWRSCLCEGLAR